MKYKALLVGRNLEVIEDFFTQPHNYLELESSSLRTEDVMNHLKYYKPHVMVYCVRSENKEAMDLIASYAKDGLPLVVVGDPEDCLEYDNTNANSADLILQRPMPIEEIEDQILDLMQEKEIDPEHRMENVAESDDVKTPEPVVSVPAPSFSPAPSISDLARRKHVLVIDDDPGNLKMLKEQLHDEYDVGIAPSGKVAMRFLENKPTDLILLDYEMPEEDGPTVMTKIRQLPAHKNTPIVFLTGITDRNKIQKALVLKPQGYLLKPIEQRKLMQTIKSLIG